MAEQESQQEKTAGRVQDTPVVQRVFKGMFQDCKPVDQPESTYRYALNGVVDNKDGTRNFITNEYGNRPSVQLTQGFVPLGTCYLTDNSTAILSHNPETGLDEIGIITKDEVYTVYCQMKLNFDLHHQIDITHRVRRAGDRLIYFTDGLNKPRYFNFNRLYDFYTFEYKSYLSDLTNWKENPIGPQPQEPDNRWDIDSFELISSYNFIPSFKNIWVRASGNIKSGSYSFGIFYVDENMNHSECTVISNPVNIYTDEFGKSYQDIHGSRITSNATFMDWGNANKSIQIELENLDERFPYYKVAVICYNAGDGNINEVLLSPVISIESKIWTYYGQDNHMEKININDIGTPSSRISRVSHIEQLENKLILADIWEKEINWLKFQKYASGIRTKLVKKQINLESVYAEGNPKNPVGPTYFTGYMPGEVYSFGICYVFKDGDISPVFHIPGNIDDMATKNIPQDPIIGDNGMMKYHCQSIYPKIHKAEEPNYWGKDWQGNNLESMPIRHHKFPFRDEAGDSLFGNWIGNMEDSESVNKTLTINLIGRISYSWTDPNLQITLPQTVKVWYKKKNDPTIHSTIAIVTPSWIITTATLVLTIPGIESEDELEEEWSGQINDFIYFNSLDGGSSSPSTQTIGTLNSGVSLSIPPLGPSAFFLCPYIFVQPMWIQEYSYASYASWDRLNFPFQSSDMEFLPNVQEDLGTASTKRPTSTYIYGIDFILPDIPLPPEYADQIAGYYIVRNKSEEADRIVIDNAVLGKVVKSKGYNYSNSDTGESYAAIGDNFITFGLLNYVERTTDNSGNPTDSERSEFKYAAKPLDNFLYAFSPQHQFKHVTIYPNKVRIMNHLVCSKEIISPPSQYFGARYIDDVRVGTTYSPEAHEKKDNDGFDLLVKYRETVIENVEILPYISYTGLGNVSVYQYPGNKPGVLNIKQSYYLSPCAHQMNDNDAVFNACQDNNIIILNLPDTNPNGTPHTYGFWGNTTMSAIHSVKSHFLYGTFINEPLDSYGNFISRPYYREHTNVKYLSEQYDVNKQYNRGDVVYDSLDVSTTTGNIVYIAKVSNKGKSLNDTDYWSKTTSAKSEIFHGDSYIGSYSLLSSVYYGIRDAKRDKKKKPWWEVIVGAVLVVAAAVVTIVTYGTGSWTLIAAISALAAGAGAVLFSNGIGASQSIDAAFELAKVHYRTGLKECIIDNHTSTFTEVPRGDDRIEWFHDRISNVFIESRMNTDLRIIETNLASNFCPAPGQAGGNNSPIWKPRFVNEGDLGINIIPKMQLFTNLLMGIYMADKMTYIDNERQEARNYRGLPMPEVYSVNDDYNHESTERTFFYLPVEYSINIENPNHYDHRIMWSETSFQEEINDNFRVFLPNNYKDIEGEFGAITDLVRKSNKLYVFTRESFWYLPANLQQQVTGDLVTVIGTGEFFSIPPQRIVTDKDGSAGTTDKWSVIVSRYGIFYASRLEGKIYRYVEPSNSYQRDPMEGLKEISLNGMYHWFRNNLPSSFGERYFKDNEKNFPFLSNPITGYGVHAIYDPDLIRVIFTLNEMEFPGDIQYLPEQWYEDDNIPDDRKFMRIPDFSQATVNKSFTISYNIITDSWTSFHSYLPKMYFSTPNGFRSWNEQWWKHNERGTHCIYYQNYYDYIIELISISSPLFTRVWEDITIQSIVEQYDQDTQDYIEIHHNIFDKIIFYNSKQSSGILQTIVRNKQDDNWMMQTIALKPGTVRANRIEHDWKINELRDMVSDYSLPMFLTDWDSIKNNYPIDKIVNPGIFGIKSWQDMQSFRDKYLVVRLILSKFAARNIQLTTKYTIESEQISIR
jgi:hypothetical protein